MQKSRIIRTIKRYGNWYRVLETPEYRPDHQRKFTRKPADNNTTKARNNYGTSMLKAYAIALNNKWEWYGILQLANDDISDFSTAYGYIKALVSRLRKIRSRSTTKNLAYLIIPDSTEQNKIQNWFVHIWLLDFPDTEKAFSQDKVTNKKIVYHWIKYERQNGKTELYRIYDSGYVTNGKYTDTVARQIFCIIKRTAKLIPKEMNLYYCSDNVIRDEVIASGTPTTLEIPSTSYNNDFVKSKWFTDKNESKNRKEALEYVVTYTEESPLQQSTCNELSSDFYCYDNIGYEENYDYEDNYFYCETEYVPQSEDYGILNDIYETGS